MDLLGVATICAAVVCYLLALQWGGGTKPWSSRDVVGTLVGFVVLTLAFIVNEWWQGERALLVSSVLKNWIITGGCVFSFLWVLVNSSASFKTWSTDEVVWIASPAASMSSSITSPSISRRLKVSMQLSRAYAHFR